MAKNLKNRKLRKGISLSHPHIDFIFGLDWPPMVNNDEEEQKVSKKRSRQSSGKTGPAAKRQRCESKEDQDYFAHNNVSGHDDEEDSPMKQRFELMNDEDVVKKLDEFIVMNNDKTDEKFAAFFGDYSDDEFMMGIREAVDENELKKEEERKRKKEEEQEKIKKMKEVDEQIKKLQEERKKILEMMARMPSEGDWQKRFLKSLNNGADSRLYAEESESEDEQEEEESEEQEERRKVEEERRHTEQIATDEECLKQFLESLKKGTDVRLYAVEPEVQERKKVEVKMEKMPSVGDWQKRFLKSLNNGADSRLYAEESEVESEEEQEEEESEEEREERLEQERKKAEEERREIELIASDEDCLKQFLDSLKKNTGRYAEKHGEPEIQLKDEHREEQEERLKEHTVERKKMKMERMPSVGDWQKRFLKSLNNGADSRLYSDESDDEQEEGESEAEEYT